MAERPQGMPERVYTVEDTIRVAISFLSESNIEEVEATFYRWEPVEYDYDEEGRPIRVVSRSTISFEGTVEEVEIAEHFRFALPFKRHTAVLVSFVDKDHDPGSYLLTHLRLRTANGFSILWEPPPDHPVPSFRVAEETDRIKAVDIQLLDEPEEG